VLGWSRGRKLGGSASELGGCRKSKGVENSVKVGGRGGRKRMNACVETEAEGTGGGAVTKNTGEEP